MLDTIAELEKKKKAAAADEDFETAMVCKKGITEKQGKVQDVKNDLTTAVVMANSETKITDKEILMAMINLEESFRNNNSDFVSHIV